MTEIKELINSINEKNDKIIESIVSGRYADVDYYAHEIKSEIDHYNRGEAFPKEETKKDILSKILNTPQSEMQKKLSKDKENSSGGTDSENGIVTKSATLSAYDEKINVLVVDDNELNLEVAERLLKKEGYHVMMANSARRAITYFANSTEGDIQVILTDITMPGMDGNEMTKEIRTLDHPAAKTIKIIALSADKSEASIKASFNAGMNGYINKPFDIAQFKRILSGASKL